MNFEYALEIIAIASFAVFGASAALENRLDIFGVIVVATVTAVGGGLVRDLILPVEVPVMFTTPMYCIVASITAVIVILVENFLRMQRVKQRFDIQKNMEVKEKFDYIVTLCDAIGMGYFSVSGVNMAIAYGRGDNVFLSVFVGVLTATGGGLLRDIMLGRKPMIFKREIYAIASIIGTVIYYYILPHMDKTLAMYLCTVIITWIRMFTKKKNVNIPSLFIQSKNNN